MRWVTAGVLAGTILVHDAFPVVLANHPERRQPDVAGYVATNDCGEMGKHFVLVRPGQADVLVAVADCSADQHRPWRESHGYIADVDSRLWIGPWRPQPAELWTPEARERYWQRWLKSEDIP